MNKEIVADKPTVHKIMNEAIPLFARKGFAAVSVKEIAEAAGVNIALISYHFGGKENLYATILKVQFELVDQIITLLHDEEDSPITKIRRFSQELIKVNKCYPYIHRLIYGEMINPSACYEGIVKPGIIRTHNFFDDCIQSAINSGQFRPEIKPDCANLLLASILHFYFFTNHLCDVFLAAEEDKAGYYMTEAIEMYLRGVLTNPFSDTVK